MEALYLILLLLAAVCFGLAVLNVVVSKINFVALGLLFWVLVPLIQTIQSR